MIVLKVLAALMSCGMIIAGFHFFYTAAYRPRRLLSLMGSMDERKRSWPYLGCVFIGVAMVFYGGFDFLLSWIPLTWGGVDADGEFRSTRHVLAGMLATLALPLISYVERAAMQELQLEKRKLRIESLERDRADALNEVPRDAS